MIIWDEKKEEHFIRIKGSEKVCIKLSDFPLAENKEDNELNIKEKIDSKTSLSEGYHAYLHIFDKPDIISPTKQLRYVIWLGPVENEPGAPSGYEWWEDWSGPEEKSVR